MNPPKLPLYEALSMSNYFNRNYGIIEKFLNENYSTNENVKIYLLKSNEKLFVVKYWIKLLIDNVPKSFYILVYLQAAFPDGEPEFYFFTERGNFTVKKNYSSEYIDPISLKINHKKYTTYNPKTMNIEQIINIFISFFSLDFPVIEEASRYNLNKGKCCVNFNNLPEIILTASEMKELRKIREDLKPQIVRKYKNTYNEIRENVNLLNNVERDLDSRLIKIQELKNECSLGQDVIKQMTSIKNEMIVTADTLVLECSNEDKFSNNKKLTLEGAESIVHIKDEDIHKYNVMKKTIEDFLFYLRKGFEKKKIPFETGISQTRQLTQELFRILYLIQKKKKNTEN